MIHHRQEWRLTLRFLALNPAVQRRSVTLLPCNPLDNLFKAGHRINSRVHNVSAAVSKLVMQLFVTIQFAEIKPRNIDHVNRIVYTLADSALYGNSPLVV